MESTRVLGCGQCDFAALSEHELQEHLINTGHHRRGGLQLLAEGPFLLQGFFHRLLRLLFGWLLLFPVASLIAFDVYALFVVETPAAIAAVVASLLTWFVGGFYVSSPRSFRRIYGRSCVFYAVAAFILPVAAIVFAATGNLEASVTGNVFFAIFAVVFGLFTGINAAILGQMSLDQSDETMGLST